MFDDSFNRRFIIEILLAALLVGEWMACARPACAAAPVGAVVLQSGDDVQSVVDRHPAGTVYSFGPGLYRLQSVKPKEGDTFISEGAILSGAKGISQFVREGPYFVATGQTQKGQAHGLCDKNHPGCKFPEDLFFDDQPLLHVVSLSSVTTGAWYFDYDQQKIYLLDNPAGHKVETSVTRVAFRPTAKNVTIRGFVIEKYANPAQMGAIGDQTGNDHWVIEGNEVRLNHGLGIRAGAGGVIRRNNSHHNGQLGIGGSGKGLLVEGNEIAYNNTLGFSVGWEAGGTKFTHTDGLVARCNYVHHNHGPGLWTDNDNINTDYEHNLVTDNDGMGIFHEISFKASIHDNIVKRNAVPWFPWLYGSQILISSSRDTQVFHNIVEVDAAGGNGIGIIQQGRLEPSTIGRHFATGNEVHDNEVTYFGNSGMSGLGADWNMFADSDQKNPKNMASFYARSQNRFDRNHYHVPDLNKSRWAWGGHPCSWAGLRAQGQEPEGTVDTHLAADPTPAGVPQCE